MGTVSFNHSLRITRNTSIFGIATLLSQQVFSAGFQLNAQSNAGLGRAFSGDAVIADNASSMSRNPATMSLFNQTSLSVGVIRLQSMVEVKDAVYQRDAYRQGELAYSSSAAANYNDAGNTVFAPNLHLVIPIDKAFAVGVNAYSNFGTSTDYDSHYIASEFAGKSEVKSYNLGLSASYRVDEQISLGIGLDIIAATGKLERQIQPSHTQLLAIEAKGWGLGFNLGTVYEIDENNRFGLAYRYSPEIEAYGDIDYVGYTKVAGPIDDTLLIPLPDMLEFSGFHQLNHSKFALHYSVQWIGWKTFDRLRAEQSGQICRYEWRDGWHFALGGTWNLDKRWTLRVGYMYDTSAQHKLTSISVPDSHRQFFSFGSTYRLSIDSDIDFGFTYVLGQDVDVDEAKPIIPVDPMNGSYISTRIQGVSRANALLMGLNYNIRF